VAGSNSEPDFLRSIDTKLSALLAIALDDYVRVHEVTGARQRPLEVMLHSAGLSTTEVADLLGKGQRAVQIAVKEKPKKTRATKKSPTNKRATKTTVTKKRRR
jgi:hypothetical protein